MKKIFCLSLFVVMMSSCGSSKTVATKKTLPSPKIVKSNDKYINKEVEKLEKKADELDIRTIAYISEFAPIAIAEMKKSKIPASITLAQGILESGSGMSNLALRSNNHFGVKCHKGWEGDSVRHDDDEAQECFRKYKDPQTSYKDHSEFLTTRSRYAFLFDFEKDDYKAWAFGLSKAGYATDKKYPEKLIQYIEKYNLHHYDKIALKKKIDDDVVMPYIDKNDLYTVNQGDTLYSISKKYALTVDDLKKLNGLQSNDITIGQTLRIK